MGDIIVWRDDDADIYYPAWTDELWAKSAIAILKRKLDLGWYYSEDDDEYQEVLRVVDEHDLSFVTYRSGRKEPLAWKLVELRSDHEYEGVSLEHLQEV